MHGIVSEARLAATNELIARYVGPKSIVVEIGSNDATFREFHLHESWTTVDKYGCPDIRSDLDGESAHLPFEDNSVDLVICTEVLEHLRMGASLVSEISRILRSDGIAIVSVPNVCSLKSRMKMVFGHLPNMAASGDCGHDLGGTGVLVDGKWVAGHVVDFNFERLRSYLERGNLRITASRKVGVKIPLGLGAKSIILPHWACPITLSDFILVAATPCFE